MPYAPRPTTIFPNSTAAVTGGARPPSSTSHTSQQSSVLASRIGAKRRELENLKQLRDLSGALAGQMGILEEKLATLREGTEAVACVLANWENVLRAISMASMKVPRPEDDNGEVDPTYQEGGQEQLPVTLVRIPAQSQDPRTHHVEANGASS